MFLLGCFFLILSCMSCLYILEINLLLVAGFANFFPMLPFWRVFAWSLLFQIKTSKWSRLKGQHPEPKCLGLKPSSITEWWWDHYLTLCVSTAVKWDWWQQQQSYRVVMRTHLSELMHTEHLEQDLQTPSAQHELTTTTTITVTATIILGWKLLYSQEVSSLRSRETQPREKACGSDLCQLCALKPKVERYHTCAK